ncbi:hypothetical protein IAU60_002499 [Kwoniella sp. DSM 27419]
MMTERTSAKQFKTTCTLPVDARTDADGGSSSTANVVPSGEQEHDLRGVPLSVRCSTIHDKKWPERTGSKGDQTARPSPRTARPTHHRSATSPSSFTIPSALLMSPLTSTHGQDVPPPSPPIRRPMRSATVSTINTDSTPDLCEELSRVTFGPVPHARSGEHSRPHIESSAKHRPIPLNIGAVRSGRATGEKAAEVGHSGNHISPLCPSASPLVLLYGKNGELDWPDTPYPPKPV